MKLTPLFIRANANKDQWGEVEALRVMDCIECGSCSYICPARIPLVQTFRVAKAQLRKQAAEKKAKEGGKA